MPPPPSPTPPQGPAGMGRRALSVAASIGAVMGIVLAIAYGTRRHYGTEPMAMKRRMMMATHSSGAPDVGVYSIFMGAYTVLIPDFLANVRAHFLPDRVKRFYLVADDPATCKQLLSTEPDVDCVVKEHMAWPYATLYRWNFFHTSFDPPESMSHIFFLNSNARCVGDITDEILGPHVAVIHNMYEDKSYQDVSFEKNPISMAYVPPAAHVRYYGGRFLGATRENFLKLCKALDTKTQIDESNHFIAAWHDESHWNHYVNMVLDERDVTVLGSEYHIPEELLKLGASVQNPQTAPKMVYLDKDTHLPGFDASKSSIWQYNVGGEVNFDHPYMTLPSFRADVYRKLNPDLAPMDDAALRLHFLAHPDTPYVHESPAFAALFDAAAYMKLYGLESELAAKFHFIHRGVWSEEFRFPVRGCHSSVSDPNTELFLTYDWQRGDRLEQYLEKRVLQGFNIFGLTPTIAPTKTPTPIPTQAPTVLKATTDWSPLASNEICAGGVPTPIPENLRRMESIEQHTTRDESAPADARIDRHALAAYSNPYIQACFEACDAYFAPNNAQFYFNVIQNGTTKICECCKTCDTLIPASGGLAMANCIPNSALTIQSKALSTRAKTGKAVVVKVWLDGTTSSTLEGLGLAITFPRGYVVAEAATALPKNAMRAPMRANGSIVLWPQFDLSPRKDLRFAAKLCVTESAPLGVDITLGAVVFQTVGSNAPYCPLSPVYPAKVRVVKARRELGATAVGESGLPTTAAAPVRPQPKSSGGQRRLATLSPTCQLGVKVLPKSSMGHPKRKAAGSDATFVVKVQSTRQVTNGVVKLLFPWGMQVLQAAVKDKDNPKASINGQTVSWRNVALAPKDIMRFVVKAQVLPCYPDTTVNVLTTAYQIDPTTGLVSCSLSTKAVPLQVTPMKALTRAKLAKHPATYNCTGAGGVSCAPGYYATTSSGVCQPCPTNSVCPGGAQPAITKCPYGTGTAAGMAFDPAQCIVLSCDPCPTAPVDLYITEELNLYMQPSWQEGISTTQNSAQLLCTLDRADYFLCAGNAAVTGDQCTLNDVAIDNQGNYILLGRRALTTGTGWVILVDPAQIVQGHPCPYTVLIPELVEPWSGLGSSPRSNLFYGVSNTKINTMQLQGTTATIINQIGGGAFNLTGASDVSSNAQGLLYVTVKSKAYGATTDANYVPVQGSLSLIASGEIVSGSGAFCTAQKQYAIARYNGQVYEFVTNGGTFSSVGGSGLPVWGRINGAAVSPVCGV